MYDNSLVSMFDSASKSMQIFIEQSPLYMDTMLALSDDIGSMADRILETQDIQSPNFLATQENMLDFTSMMLDSFSIM